MIDIYIKGKNGKGVCVISGEENEEFIEEFSGLSNNQCEWKSIIKAMNIISGEEFEEVDIYMDSLLVYRQINFIYHIKNKDLKNIYFEWNQLKNVLSGTNINYKYVSGQENPARKLL